MSKSRLELSKWITFTIPDDPFLDKKDDEYYEELTRNWSYKFDSIAKSIGKGYGVFADIDNHDGSTEYLSYEIIYLKMVSDYSPFDIQQIMLDLETIRVIMLTLVENEMVE